VHRIDPVGGFSSKFERNACLASAAKPVRPSVRGAEINEQFDPERRKPRQSAPAEPGENSRSGRVALVLREGPPRR
jgi:hypothetical protein